LIPIKVRNDCLAGKYFCPFRLKISRSSGRYGPGWLAATGEDRETASVQMEHSEKSDIDLFTEALQRPAGEERDAFLLDACADNEPLRRRVNELLEAQALTSDFLEEVPPEVKARAEAHGEQPGDRIGRYKLLQQIGEGGCGIVFMAEQEEPVRRKVAVKIVKPGMDSKTVIARFEAERQALALMNHPNIANVLDAGSTASGRPYFVMELVRGVKITEYCDQHAVTTRQRLEMFVEVCDAIQHAHHKGIIHRDLKPSNILVTTLPSGKALPKVIDFGIAKATTGQRLTDKTLFTAFEMLIGTPAYMSPEQAALSSMDVDTRSDIYSLGMLLYELLTGNTPFDTAELLKQGLDEVRRVICHADPPTPSTRLSTLVASDLTAVSRLRRADPPKLLRDIRGDLDWIVMKALEKDRARRYPTVNGFAMDVGRYLEGEAVLAGPPSALYRFKRSVQRHRLFFTAAAVISLLSVISVFTTIRLLVEERRMRRELAVTRPFEEAELLQNVERFDDAANKSVEAFKLQAQYFGLNNSRSVELLKFALGSLVRAHRAAEAAKLAADYYIAPDQVNFEAKRLVLWRALALGQLGRWREASTDARHILKDGPDSDAYHILIACQIALQDVAGYRESSRSLFNSFRSTTLPSEADKVVKDCCAIPQPDLDLEALESLSDLAVNRGKGEVPYTFYLFSKALCEYRRGNFSDSIEWADKVLKDPFPYTQAEASAVRAMAEFKVKNLSEAEASLSNLQKTMETRLPKATAADLGQDWRDLVFASALQNEATNLIIGSSHE
jgi:serine/threonine protein kinase